MTNSSQPGFLTTVPLDQGEQQINVLKPNKPTSSMKTGDSIDIGEDNVVSASTYSDSAEQQQQPDSESKTTSTDQLYVENDELLDRVQELFAELILVEEISQSQLDFLYKFLACTVLRLAKEGATILLRKLLTLVTKTWDVSEETENNLKTQILDVNHHDQAHDGNTPMHNAASTDAVGCMHLLREFGADCNIRNNDGRTPLHTAAMNGSTEAVRFLITKGQADVNIQDFRGTTSFSSVTPLQLSMLNREYETAKILVYFGAKVSTQTRALIFSSAVNNRAKNIAEIPIDQHGFIVEEGSSSDAKDNRSKFQVKKDQQRTSKWAEMMIREYSGKNREKAKERARKGIPNNVRGVAWYFLTNARHLQEKYPNLYEELKFKNTPHSEQIDADINRTFRDHILFYERYGERQTSLFNVLRAYSNYNEELGYCQGMSSIAAFLLMHVSEEIDVFWMLVDIISSYGIESNFTTGLVGAKESFYIHDRLLKKLMPKLHRHLQKNDVDVSFYATKWYMELFIGSMPFEFTLRVWDIFLSHGYKSIFLMSMAVMHYLQPRLMQANGIEEIRNVLKEEVFHVPWDIDHLVKYYRRHNISTRKLERYREECRSQSQDFM